MEKRSETAHQTGTKHIEQQSCADEFRNVERRHFEGPAGPAQEEVLNLGKLRQVYTEDGKLLKYNQSASLSS